MIPVFAECIQSKRTAAELSDLRQFFSVQIKNTKVSLKPFQRLGAEPALTISRCRKSSLKPDLPRFKISHKKEKQQNFAQALI